MPDPLNPTPVPAPGSGPTSTSTGLPSNVAAALACIPLFGGVIFYIIEKQDQFVRFYAMQSIIFGGVWFLFAVVAHIIGAILWSIPVAGIFFGGLWGFVAALVQLGMLVLMIIAMVKAFSGVRWDIPVVGPLARKQMGGE
jgi:uncharacterized membrane protein